MHPHIPARALAILALLICVPGVRPAQAVPEGVTASIIDPDWILVNPRNPLMLFAGGNGMMDRSVDGGTTWLQVLANLPVPDSGCPAYIDGPAVLSSDGRHLVVIADKGCPPNSRADFNSLFMSPDAGTTVDSGGIIGAPEGALDPLVSPVMSPASPLRVYDLVSGGGQSPDVWTSADGGHDWTSAGGDQLPYSLLSPAGYFASITADPRLASTVYANLETQDDSGVQHQAGALRSDDAGVTWTTIMTPTASPALQSFWLSTDPLLPGTLIGQTSDPGVAPDVRFYSDDSGRTWTRGTCMGDLAGACPTITIGAAFGAGSSYAFTGRGIYAFTGRSPAGARLPISDRLPVPATHITAAQAGPQPGDPVYILADGQLYRSADAGRIWRLLTVVQGLVPNLLPPSTAPGTLLVPQAHHAVGSAFVAAYKRFGLAVTGYPVTEAYLEHGTLYQDFQRVRLRLGGLGAVKVAPLGTMLYAYYARATDTTGAAYRRAGVAVPPVPSTAAQRYFPATKHVLRNPFLGYWQQYGGMVVFGAPISEVFRAPNGDGSGRTYTMQYFTNARLELHPEVNNPLYRVQVGLLGSEALAARGWQVPPRESGGH